MSSGARFQRVEDDAGELAFEAAECFAAALALGLFAFEVGARGRVDACLCDRDAVQGAVELAVAATVEPVALVLAGAGFERCDAGVAGKLGVCVEALDRADLGEQFGGAEWAAAGQLTMPVVMLSGHGTIETAVEATRIGAFDFLEKPVALQRLLALRD